MKRLVFYTIAVLMICFSTSAIAGTTTTNKYMAVWRNTDQWDIDYSPTYVGGCSGISNCRKYVTSELVTEDIDKVQVMIKRDDGTQYNYFQFWYYVTCGGDVSATDTNVYYGSGKHYGYETNQIENRDYVAGGICATEEKMMGVEYKYSSGGTLYSRVYALQ